MNLIIGINILLMKIQKIIKSKSLPSFCTGNFDVLKSILIFCKYYNLPVLIDPISVLSCKVITIVESPDHPVFISKINGVDLRKYSDPL